MNEKRIASSFLWKFIERMSSQIINLVVQIVLARLIEPSDFGVLAILIIFANVSTILIQKGLSSSLIRKKNADENDYNTAFWAGLSIAVIILIILFFSAPLVARLYQLEQLKLGLRLISISLVFGSLYSVQNAILVRDLRFKAIFVRGLISASVSGIIGIIMAVRGMGIWALIAQTVSNQILLCVTVWNQTGWKPRACFSKERLHEIMSFGGGVLISELLSYAVESLRTLFIGGFYSPTALSYYDRGHTYPSTMMRGVYDTIGSVLLPAFSKNQDDDELLVISLKKVVSLSMFIIFPVFFGFAAASGSLIRLILTEKWVPAIPYIIVFSFSYLSQPIQGICRQIIYAKGQSKIILKIEVIKDVVSVAALLAALKIGVFAVAVSFLVSMYFAAFLMMLYVSRLLPVRIIDLLLCVGRSVLYSALMFILVYLFGFIHMRLFLKLVIQILIGIVTYFGMAMLFKDNNMKRCVCMIREMIGQ